MSTRQTKSFHLYKETISASLGSISFVIRLRIFDQNSPLVFESRLIVDFISFLMQTIHLHVFRYQGIDAVGVDMQPIENFNEWRVCERRRVMAAVSLCKFAFADDLFYIVSSSRRFLRPKHVRRRCC